jgi:hypothetical protein
MLLYTHPLNDERAARGLLPVNSFWLSGCGVAQPEAPNPPAVDERLRAPALAENWPAWCQAWTTLDDGPIQDLQRRAERGEPVALTLCGENAWVRLENRETGWWPRLRRRLSPPTPLSLLETL